MVQKGKVLGRFLDTEFWAKLKVVFGVETHIFEWLFWDFSTKHGILL
jgi:hypothetical protein